MVGEKYYFVVDQQDLDFMQRASVSSVVRYLLSTAGLDASKRGFGLSTISGENHTWVLSRLAVELYSMPRLNDRLEIRTWVSSAERLFSTRNFVVTNQRGENIASATSLWTMIDLTTRRAINLSTMSIESFDQAPPIDAPRRIDSSATELVSQHRVSYSDVDFNCHVNTIKYINMMMDAQPIDYLHGDGGYRVDLYFMSESKMGELLNIKYADSITEITHEDGVASFKGQFEFIVG